MDPFPHGLDYAWLAVDAAGHVAVFTNAGAGPIPAAVLADRETADRAERLVRELPERGGCRMLVALPRPDDFMAFARRGFFAYDWQDVHRPAARTRRYDLVTRPGAPVLIDEVRADVAALARRVRFERLRFEESPSLAVVDELECTRA